MWIAVFLFRVLLSVDSQETFILNGYAASLDLDVGISLETEQTECAILCMNTGQCPGFQHFVRKGIQPERCYLDHDAGVESLVQDSFREAIYEVRIPKFEVHAALYHTSQEKYLLFVGRQVYEYDSMEQMTTGPTTEPYLITEIYPNLKTRNIDAIVGLQVGSWFYQYVFFGGDSWQVYKTMAASPSNDILHAEFVEEGSPIPDKFGGSSDYQSAFHIQTCFENATNDCRNTIKYKLYFLGATKAHLVLGEVYDDPDELTFRYLAAYNLVSIPGLPPMRPDINAAVVDQKYLIFAMFSGTRFMQYDLVAKSYSAVKSIVFH